MHLTLLTGSFAWRVIKRFKLKSNFNISILSGVANLGQICLQEQPKPGFRDPPSRLEITILLIQLDSSLILLGENTASCP